MAKAPDPFEEYLRKKKVELLESKFREKPVHAVADDDDEEIRPPSNDDPELEAKVKEEVDDFFTTGQEVGQHVFEEAEVGLPEDKVEEIRDALDDVFEEDAVPPQAEDRHAFVDFFKQVHDAYEPGTTEPRDEGPDLDSPFVIEDAEEEIVADVGDLARTAVEVSTDELVAVEAPEDRPKASRLSLNDILTPPTNEEELLARVDLLGRLVTKLVERSRLPESEIIEVLIRAGVEF